MKILSRRAISRLRFILTATGFALLVMSCSSASSSSRFRSSRQDPGSNVVTIEVVNDHAYSMDVFVMRGGSHLRLGTVTGKMTQTFTVDPDRIQISAGLRLLADPVGSRDAFLSDAVMVEPGSIVVLNIFPVLGQSFVILR